MVKTRFPGVYKRGSKYVATYRDRQGAQRKESANTLNDARAIKARREVESKGGFKVGGRLIPFHEYAEKWMEDLQYAPGRRDRTKRDYCRQMKKYILYFFPEKTRLGDITPGDVDRFVAWLMRSTGSHDALAPATARRILVPFRICMEQARRDGLIDANPVDDVRVSGSRSLSLGQRGNRAKALDRVELARLLKEIPTEHSLFFRLLAATGARWSEAIAWKPGDLVPPDKSILVERSVQDGTEYAPKTPQSRRSIPLASGLFKELEVIGAALAPDEYLFSEGDGRPLSYWTMKARVLDPAASRAGLDGVGFHSLRHTAASILFANGVNIKEVQTFLGHSTPGFTLNTYVHLIPGANVGTPVDLDAELRPTGIWP
jgi:integrase